MPKRQRSNGHTLAHQIRKARREKKHTLRSLAEAAGYSYGFISDLEHGRRNTTEGVLQNLAKALGISAAPLLKASKAERVAALKARTAEQIAELSR